jgi:hypothetical protein
LVIIQFHFKMHGPYNIKIRNVSTYKWQHLHSGIHLCSTTQQLPVGFLIIAASRSYSRAPRSVGLLYTREQSDAQTNTWQHTTITADRHPCLWLDSNPQSQQLSGRRPTPKTARPLGPAYRYSTSY